MIKVLSEVEAKSIREEPRFCGIKPLENRKRMLLSPVMYSGEITAMEKARLLGVSGKSVYSLEKEIAGFIGANHAIALSSGTAALHMALRLATEKVYGSRAEGGESNGCNSNSCKNSGCRSTGIYGNGNSRIENSGVLCGHRVFCSDLTSSAMANSVVCEGGEPVFIDASGEDWGMDPDVLEIAFERYPDVKIVMMAHIYGFPGQIGRVKKICEEHGALLIEDAGESLGATVGGRQTGSFGDYGVLSFHNDDIMPEVGGGMLLLDDFSEAEKVRQWILHSQAESAQKWHGVPGYNNRMGDMEAEIIRRRMNCLGEYIEKKKAIYERYRKSFLEDLMRINPIGEGTEPSYGVPCMTVESSIGFIETRYEKKYKYTSQHGTAAPMEILDVLTAFGVAGKPVWKPMHMQPIFGSYDQITLDGIKRDYESSRHNDFFARCDESADIFRKGICLPTGIGMTEEEQDRIIAIIFACYSRRELNRKIWCAV